MTAYNRELFDQYGRPIVDVQYNTKKDGSGIFYFPVVDSDGKIKLGTVDVVPYNPVGIAITPTVTEELLKDIFCQLKLMNIHLAEITNLELKEEDEDDNY